ncbi:MAG: hypothetical protein JWN48_2733 [Myxococcaceae bacterium]|nr:hypothetical protein [Myxococcaceae bacterium]
MANLEEHAFKRDKRFVVRLVFTIVVAVLGGLFVSGRLTNQSTAGCAANALVEQQGRGSLPASK